MQARRVRDSEDKQKNKIKQFEIVLPGQIGQIYKTIDILLYCLILWVSIS